jgi:hypothetical protein
MSLHCIASADASRPGAIISVNAIGMAACTQVVLVIGVLPIFVTSF